MLNKMFKSILEQDKAPIVVCNMDDIIVYMNPSAKSAYHKDLTGSNANVQMGTCLVLQVF